MYILIELPTKENGYFASFENVETQEIKQVHRRDYLGNIALNQTVNLANILK